MTTKQETFPAIELLNVEQVSRALGLSTRKVWSLTNCGALPCVKIGRSVRYSVMDIENWIDLHRIAAEGKR